MMRLFSIFANMKHCPIQNWKHPRQTLQAWWRNRKNVLVRGRCCADITHHFAAAGKTHRNNKTQSHNLERSRAPCLFARADSGPTVGRNGGAVEQKKPIDNEGIRWSKGVTIRWGDIKGKGWSETRQPEEAWNAHEKIGLCQENVQAGGIAQRDSVEVESMSWLGVREREIESEDREGIKQVRGNARAFNRSKQQGGKKRTMGSPDRDSAIPPKVAPAMSRASVRLRFKWNTAQHSRRKKKPWNGGRRF